MKPPYLIAEIGVNHGGDRVLAERMVREAASAGVDAVKFQYYKADDLAAPDSPTYFAQTGEPAKTQREFFARYDSLRREDYEHLARVAQRCGVDFGCTVFQPEDVPWVDTLVKWHKVASADIDNWPLLEAVGECRKQVFLSTGAATPEECHKADELLSTEFAVVPFHCVLNYPTPFDRANLAAINEMYRVWCVTRVGYSDHTVFSLDVLTTAWLLGAQYIEKHFTLDKAQAGNDHYHSMDPSDVRAFRRRCAELAPLIGDGKKATIPTHEQLAYREARRSLYAAQDLPAGHVLTQADLRYLRPAHGLRPGQEGVLLGKRLAVAVPRHTLLTEAVLG